MARPPWKGTMAGVSCAILILSGCAPSGQSSAGQSGSQDRNLITKTDLEGMEELTAYEAIRRLKPNWLQYRGQAVLTGADRETLRVYVDRIFFGEAESLSTLTVRNIQEIRFLDPRQATLRFGTGHTVGAIVITTGGM